MERRQRVPAQGKKPLKPSRKNALEMATEEEIRMTLEKDGSIKGVTEQELRQILGLMGKRKIPKREEYSQEQLMAVKNYYLDHLPEEQVREIQVQHLIKNVLETKPEADTTSFRLQKEVLTELIKQRYGKTPSDRQLADLATSFSIKGEDDKQLTVEEYQKLYYNNQFIRTPDDLVIVHEAIKKIPNPKVENNVRQAYAKIYKQYSDPVLRQKAYQSETGEESGYETEAEQRKGGPKITKFSTSELEILRKQLSKTYRKMENKPLVNNGDNQDFTGQRSQVPVGIIEESKHEQIKGSASEAESLQGKQDKRKPIRKIRVPAKKQTSGSELADLKVAQKEVVRNGGQNGADLAVVENKEEVFTYNEKYPELDEMLNLSITRQLEFDLAQRKHLNRAQIELMQEVLSTGAIYKPNVDFLREKYKHEPTEANLEKYNQAIISQIGKEVAYYGGEPNFNEKTGKITSTQEMAQIKPAKKGKFGAENIQDEVIVKEIAGQKSAFKKQASKNMVAPALQVDLTKPQMLTIADITRGIAQIIEYISKLSGNLDTPDLRQYEKVTEIFKGSVIKKEPSQFKPQAGQGFKVRQLEC